MPVLRHSSFLNEVSASQKNAVTGQDEVTDSDDKAKLVGSKAKRKAKKNVQRPSKRHQTTTTINPHSVVHEDDDVEDHDAVAQVLNCVRRTTTYGRTHDDELDLSGGQDWFQRTDYCELVVRDPDAQLPSEFQHQMAEVKLNHVKKKSEAVLETEDKMRTEMMKCDIEVKRGRGEMQLLLEKVLARQAMKKEGVPKEDIDFALPLKESCKVLLLLRVVEVSCMFG